MGLFENLKAKRKGCTLPFLREKQNDSRPPPSVGVGSHSLDPSAIASLMNLGVDKVRHTLYWRLYQTNQDYADEFDRGIRIAFDAGFDLLIVVHQSQFGAYEGRKKTYREYADFMEKIVGRFPEVEAWQLWNEMDVAFTDLFGAGIPYVSMYQRGLNYSHMLELAYPAIKEANPHAIVVTGGTGSAVYSGFLEGVLEEKRKKLFDVVAIHTYGFPLGPVVNNKGIEINELVEETPIWLTEFGMHSGLVPPDWPSSPADQDQYHLEAWRDTLQMNDTLKFFDRAYGHVLEQGDDFDCRLVREDGSPRPAYIWMQQWLKERE